MVGSVILLALFAAVYTLRVGSGGEATPGSDEVVTNLRTSNAGTVRSIRHPLIGSEMPDTTLLGLDGKSYRLTDFAGKQLILIYWASW